MNPPVIAVPLLCFFVCSCPRCTQTCGCSLIAVPLLYLFVLAPGVHNHVAALLSLGHYCVFCLFSTQVYTDVWRLLHRSAIIVFVCLFLPQVYTDVWLLPHRCAITVFVCLFLPQVYTDVWLLSYRCAITVFVCLLLHQVYTDVWLLPHRCAIIVFVCLFLPQVYTDVWLLTLEVSAPWRWTKLTVECPELAAPQTWCHAACRVGCGLSSLFL